MDRVVELVITWPDGTVDRQTFSRVVEMSIEADMRQRAAREGEDPGCVHWEPVGRTVVTLIDEGGVENG